MLYVKWLNRKSPCLFHNNQNILFLNGFTLIELLVVVSIIGVLAGLLLPALSAARQRAQKTACISNLRQIGLALTSYADDYNSLCPIAGNYIQWDKIDPLPAGTGTYGWMQQLYGYVNDKKLYSCPANKEFPDYAYFLSTKAAYEDARGKFAATNMNKIKYSSNFVLAGDTTSGGFPPEKNFIVDDCDKDDYTQNCVGGPQPLASDWTGWQVHMKGQNILFADGHADWFRGYVKYVMTFRYDRLNEW